MGRSAAMIRRQRRHRRPVLLMRGPVSDRTHSPASSESHVCGFRTFRLAFNLGLSRRRRPRLRMAASVLPDDDAGPIEAKWYSASVRDYPQLLSRSQGHKPLGWPERGALPAPSDLRLGRVAKGFCSHLKDYLDHPEDDAYWRQLSVRDKAHEINVPIFHVASWYDGFLEGGLHNFSNIRQHGMTSEARAGQRLLVGPWPHLYPYDVPTSAVGELDMGPEALIRTNDIEQRWFDYWLKGIDTGIKNERPVQIFVMGDNVWREEDEWPLARTKYTPFYLHSGGRANTLNGNGTLSRVPPPSEQRADSFVYDPDDPVPTIGGSQLGPNPTGPCDQRPIEARQDVLVYTSEPVREDLEITGPLSVKLFAASTAADTDFTAKLVDVWPNGYAQNLQDGIIRARYRSSSTHPALITANAVYEYTIDLWATSHVIKPGHRIRVEISSSNFPHYDRNLNTGGPLFKEKDFKRATQTVFHDAARPSHIILPLIPR